MGPVRQCLKDAGVEPRTSTRSCWSAARPASRRSRQLVKDYFGKEPHKGVNPDEVVAIGAAIQAGVLAGRRQGPAAARRHSAVARHRDPGRRRPPASSSATPPSPRRRPRSSRPRPTTRPPSRSTSCRASGRWPGQPDPRQVPARRASRPAPRGVPQIEVTFDIDANGIVNVSAKDRATGKSQAITITASSGLAKDEVERMVKEAAAHSEDDKHKREEIEAKNKADTLVYSTEKTLNENRDKLPAEMASEVEKAMADARQAVEAGGVPRMEQAVADLTKAAHRLAETLYKNASSPAEGGEGRDGARRTRPSRRRRDRRRGGGQEVGRRRMDKDLYELMGLRRGATLVELRRAHQRLVRQFHPAINPGDLAAAERFHLVKAAFEVLSNPERRAAYDRGEKVHAPAAVARGPLRGVRLLGRGPGGKRRLQGDLRRRAPGRRGLGARPRRGPRAAHGAELRRGLPRDQAAGAPGAPRGLRRLWRIGRRRRRPGALCPLPGHRPGAGQPWPHDLLPRLPRLRRPGHHHPQGLHALPRRRPLRGQRMAGRRDPAGRRERQPGPAARLREQRPPRRAGGGLPPVDRGGAASRVPPRGRRPLSARWRCPWSTRPWAATWTWRPRTDA